MPNRFDVLALGNVLVDYLIHVPDSVITQHNLNRGNMQLMDPAAIAVVRNGLEQEGRVVSGGSAANTIAHMATRGLSCGYIGKTANDDLGAIFRNDFAKLGVTFDTPQAANDSTGSCLCLVTPDGERTMCTALGVSTELSESDIDEVMIKNADLVYLEGYLFDKPAAKAAFRHAAKIAKAHNVKVALTLSDGFCVTRHRDDFLSLVKHCDIVFANAEEAMTLTATPSVEEAVAALSKDVPLMVVTMSEGGAMAALQGNAPVHVSTTPVPVLDATGAGDAFAAGFLAAHCQGETLEAALTQGNELAGEVIQRLGAR